MYAAGVAYIAAGIYLGYMYFTNPQVITAISILATVSGLVIMFFAVGEQEKGN